MRLKTPEGVVSKRQRMNAIAAEVIVSVELQHHADIDVVAECLRLGDERRILARVSQRDRAGRIAQSHVAHI